MNATRAARWALGVTAAIGCLVSGVFAHEFIYPVSGTITSTYYSSRPYGNHGALDIAGNNGKAIGAARAGTVVLAAWNGGYGKCVIVDHGSGYRTLYGHMSSIAVHSGQHVDLGSVLGYVGSTGNSTGPHCHFEVRKNNVKQAFPPYHTGAWVTKGAKIPKDI
ncbi:MAG: M23 family metallopeptidase [Planctomycetes bacterium]|nr:M23 family metallopeptidase [Planctomycetota bacterium]